MSSLFEITLNAVERFVATILVHHCPSINCAKKQGNHCHLCCTDNDLKFDDIQHCCIEDDDFK